jgi:hypothetical protein
MAQTGTNVSGIISQDTTWTPSNGPYNFTGDVTIASGVILTIEPGTEVTQFSGCDSYFPPGEFFTLQVNGTLRAEGTDEEPIGFGNLMIVFSPSSTSWNTQTSSGSIMQYTEYASGVQTNNASPKIDNNQVESVAVWGGSPIISNNVVITGIGVETGSPVIYNNTITAESEGYPTEAPAINFEGQNTALVYDNHITGEFSVSAGSPVIENNFISGSVVMSAGSPLVKNNFIRFGGITIYGNTNPLIENNTIATNTIGLNIYDSKESPSPTIEYNNFEQNSQYNIYLGLQGSYGSTAPNVNASNNWWGTTDISVINQTIYDFKDNYNVGTVTFTPILNAPNTEATPNPNAPISTSNPAQTATPTAQPGQSSSPSTQPNTQNPTWTLTETELLGVIAVLLAVILGLFVTFIIFWRRTKTPKVSKQELE